MADRGWFAINGWDWSPQVMQTPWLFLSTRAREGRGGGRWDSANEDSLPFQNPEIYTRSRYAPAREKGWFCDP